MLLEYHLPTIADHNVVLMYLCRIGTTEGFVYYILAQAAISEEKLWSKRSAFLGTPKELGL